MNKHDIDQVQALAMIVADLSMRLNDLELHLLKEAVDAAQVKPKSSCSGCKNSSCGKVNQL